jgi:hypothetical protein
MILDQILLAARKHYLRYWKNCWQADEKHTCPTCSFDSKGIVGFGAGDRFV